MSPHRAALLLIAQNKSTVRFRDRGGQTGEADQLEKRVDKRNREEEATLSFEMEKKRKR